MYEHLWGHFLRGLGFLIAASLILAAVDAALVPGMARLIGPVSMPAFCVGLFWPIITSVAKQLR